MAPPVAPSLHLEGSWRNVLNLGFLPQACEREREGECVCWESGERGWVGGGTGERADQNLEP